MITLLNFIHEKYSFKYVIQAILLSAQNMHLR